MAFLIYILVNYFSEIDFVGILVSSEFGETD